MSHPNPSNPQACKSMTALADGRTVGIKNVDIRVKNMVYDEKINKGDTQSSVWIEDLLEQIEIAESNLEDQKEVKLKYEMDECEGVDHNKDLIEIRAAIQTTERNIQSLQQEKTEYVSP